MAIFSIQVGTPTSSAAVVLEEDEETLGELLELLFPLQTEDAYINWNGVRVALSYKYDVSTILPDILFMVQELLARPNGKLTIVWPSSSFRAIWRLAWSSGQLCVEPEWESITGNIESALEASGKLDISIDDFVAEWMGLLRLIAERLEGLEGASLPELDGASTLREVLLSAERLGRGRLYKTAG